jgi:parvulin-like peptidyl-prolyl isomerase
MNSLSKAPRFALPLAALAAAATLAAGCGGGSGGSALASGVVADVNGVEITQAQLEEVISQAKSSLEAQNQKIPAAGSEQYQQLQQSALRYLVQKIEYQQKADELGVSVSDKQVDERLQQLIKQYFGGSEKKYREALERQGIADADYREVLRTQVLAEAIFEKVQATAEVTPAEVRQYYDAHPELYQQAESREVRHILVKSKALADRIYRQLKAGASFKALVEKYSTDTASKSIGGELTDTKGSFVQPFEKVAFTLRTGEISKPVKTQYGWHVIEALTPIKPPQRTPFAKVRETIEQTLLSQKKSTALSKWLDDLKKEYASKIDYAPGFAPPATETTPTETSSR